MTTAITEMMIAVIANAVIFWAVGAIAVPILSDSLSVNTMCSLSVYLPGALMWGTIPRAPGSPQPTPSLYRVKVSSWQEPADLLPSSKPR